MKFLYRMNSAPAGRYYTDQGVKDRVPVIELDRKKEKALYCGTLWYDKKGQPWEVIGERGIASDFPGIEEAYKFLTDYLNGMEVPFCITFG